MDDQATPLTQEERAELERLRAEKAEREEAEQARREREELERLRAESAESKRQEPARDEGRKESQTQLTNEDRRVLEARERGRRLMEPDDDLSMPLGQKVVLLGMLVIVVIIVLALVFAPK